MTIARRCEMAELSRWDDEYGEMVLEYLYGLDHSVLVDMVVAMMRDTEVEQMIDDITQRERQEVK
jgi:hypothetical protein